MEANSRYVLILVLAVPPDIVYGGDTSADLAVAEGDNATLSCRATGRPPPRVSWRREDGEPIVIRASTAGEIGDQRCVCEGLITSNNSANDGTNE